jgi:hypothetical protein
MTKTPVIKAKPSVNFRYCPIKIVFLNFKRRWAKKSSTILIANSTSGVTF